MGVDLLEIGVKLRRVLIVIIKGCFRSVCNHPFLVGMLCFLIFMYRLSPFVFSLLVSASPVLVCTAVLLGTLLSFGQPNIPEIEVEEKTTTHEVVSVKTGVLGDATVVKKNESYYVERFSEKTGDEDEVGEVRRQDFSDDTEPLIEERSLERVLDDGETWEANRELADLRFKQKDEWNEEMLNDGEVGENHYAKVNDELDDENSDADSFDSEKVNVDSLDSPPRSPWKRIEEREDEEEKGEQEDGEDEDEDDDDLDSGSDRAESSSPDASMADIMPMLDELHPLLDEEAPQPLHLSRNGSDAGSERSLKSTATSHKSDDDTENQEDMEAADDDNEDGEDEEDALGDKEEETKSAITWTEEDQKNLMDLGSSEIERNQRLESLILRRRARKNVGLFPERNLIDLDISDRPFNIAPISTRRQNPFDLPKDTYDDSGLPPIPGSAPSILLPRQNPFDIPYDSGEEKPNLMGDVFQEEFLTLQSREPFFRRHESFNVRSSLFAPGRQAAQMRPYFVPEGSVSEESSYSSFRRQLSELSDSKVSSVPETESIGSVEDVEKRKIREEDNREEVEAVGSVEDVEERKLLEEDNREEVDAVAWTKEITEEGPSEDLKLISEQEEVTKEDVPQEQEPISKMESVAKLVRHGSSSSSSEDSLELGQVEKREVEVSGLEFQLRDNSDCIQEGSITEMVEVQLYNSNTESVEQGYSRGSSSSSLSVSERVFTKTEGNGPLIFEVRQDVVADEPIIITQTLVESTDLSITSTLEGDGLSILEGRQDLVAEEAVISTQTSVESTALSTTSTLVNNIPQREPVYDSSPRELRKNLSSSLISSDFCQESDLGFSHVLVKTTVSEGSSQEIEMNITGNVEMLPESSTGRLIDESRPIDVVDIREHDNINTDFSGVDHKSESEGSSTAMKSSVETLVEENLIKPHISGEIPSSSADKNIVESSEEQNLDQSQEKYLLISEESLREVVEPPLLCQPKAEDSIDIEETGESPKPDAGIDDEADEKLVSTPSAEGNTSIFHDKAISEPVFKHIDEVQASNTPVQSSEDVPTSQQPDVPEIQELGHDTPSNFNSPLSPDFISIPSTASEKTSSHVDVPTIVEEADEIKEIDEGLLSELDNVGDFSIKQWESGSSEFEKCRFFIGESFSSAYHTETSTMSVAEINSVKESKTEYAMHSERLMEDMNIHEGGMEHIDVSTMGSNERNGQDSPDWGTSQDKTMSKENDSPPAHSIVLPDSVDSVSMKDESTSVETASHAGQVDMDTTSEMPELEARTIEDINLAFKQIGAKEIEKPVILEPRQAEPVVGETITEPSEDDKLHGNSSLTKSTHEESVLEVRPIEYATSNYKQLSDDSIERPKLPDLVESQETQGTCSELHIAEHIPPESITLPPKQMLDGDTEKQPKLNSDDVLVDKVGPSVKASSVKEISAFADEKPEQKVEAPEDLHSTTSVKGKGKITKSSSSSSSSSSESSSSDSDRE